MNLAGMATVIITRHQAVGRRSLDMRVLKPIQREQAFAETPGADHVISSTSPSSSFRLEDSSSDLFDELKPPIPLKRSRTLKFFF